jgi:hypothetical protein
MDGDAPSKMTLVKGPGIPDRLDQRHQVCGKFIPTRACARRPIEPATQRVFGLPSFAPLARFPP